MSFDFQRAVNIFRSEYDYRHPKVRLSLVTYMIDAGVLPDQDNPQKFIDTLDAIAKWANEDREEYYEYLESFVSEEDEDTTTASSFTAADWTKSPDGGAYL